MAAKRAVMVVHGVGDQKPGWTVEEFANCYSAHTGVYLYPERGVYNLPDASHKDESKQIKTFPSHMVRAKTENGDEVVFAEVLWADISRVGPGVVGALRGFFNLVFGFPHITREASESVGSKPPKKSVKALHDVSQLIALLIRGPLIGLTLLAVLTGVFVGIVQSFPAENIKPDADLMALIFGGLIALFAHMALNGFTERSWAPVSIYWLIIFSLLLMAIGITKLLTNLEDRSLLSYANLISNTIFYIWLFIAILFIFLLIFWAVSLVRVDSEKRQGVNITFFGTSIMAGSWGLGMSVFWVVLHERLSKYLEIDIESIYGFSLSSGIFIWISASIFSAWFLVAWIMRNNWRKKYYRGTTNGNSPPRLILPNYIEVCFFIIAVLWIMFMLYLAPEIFNEHNGKVTSVKYSNEFAFIATLTVSGLATFGHKPFGVGLDIALDVINHFRKEPITIKGVTGALTADRTAPGKYFLRKRMIDRFLTVHRHLMASEEPQQITIVAHSQGSMIAIHALAENALPTPVRGNRLITMGSPYTNLYGRFFPQKLPDLSKGHFKELKEWINIYRADDFVGTSITATSIQPSVINKEVAPRGHTGYWSDKDILDHINL